MNPHDDSSDDEDDEFTPISMVQQFLYENGYHKTLEMLTTESGKKYRNKESAFGSGFETMIFDYKDKMLRQQLFETNLDDDKVDLLQERGDKTFATKMVEDFTGVHKANILSISFSHDASQKMIATGSTDRTVKLTDYSDGKLIHQFDSDFSSAVISLDFNPNQELKQLLLGASMDGSHFIVDVEKKQVVQTFHDHRKYVVVAKWHPSGKMFATGSHDRTARLYRWNDESNSFQFVESFEFNQNVETIAFTNDGNKMYIGVRETNYLQIFNLANGNEKTKLNMNEKGDDHVSFSALNIQFHPTDDSFFLVATDRGRMILYQQGNSVPLRNFWGADNDMYSNPRCAWHHSGKYVYCTSQDYKIHCWEVSNQTSVSKLVGHKSTVRDLVHHPVENLLATCSFDKSVKLWSP
eukprot:TRINITY_DN8280_c0_g1_i2.p1 TRINITY_DN8280_c0_g1~~TRINITY_DN8280_c0_g1_i2.p1  ORF type:complete len:409 (+),score=118.06 TRINITY_DN8280_c0_g1_i2:67-1293(+)